MKISLVPPQCADDVWATVEPFLRKSTDMSGGRWTTDDVLVSIKAEVFHLWIAIDDNDIVAAATTSFTDYPQKRMLTGQFLGGGRLKEWVGLLDDMLRRWGRDHNCAGIELTGRNGWARALKVLDWSPKFTVMEKSYE